MMGKTKTSAKAGSRVFALPNPFQRPLFRQVAETLVVGPLEKLTSLHDVNRIYDGINRDDPDDFLSQTLEAFGVAFSVAEADLARVPREGPLLVVANHPFGAIEGVILCRLLQRVRPDFKLLANFMLERIPEMRPFLISVDPFGGGAAKGRNLAPMRSALRWLRQGAVLGVFPAGEVAHLHLLRDRGVTDPPWSPTVARLARMAGVPVLPVFFDGRNSLLFQMVGLIHPRMRTVMLPRELVNKRRQEIRVAVGNPIPPAKIAALDGDAELTAYLRLRTFLLKHRIAATPAAPKRPRLSRPARRAGAAAPEAIRAPVPAAEIRREVAALPAEFILDGSGEMQVIFAEAGRIPNLLNEIGRQREITFRLAGEGTGKAIDLDAFDERYLHLFLWHQERQELVGAYRLGQTDLILPAQGKAGLYTSTLFDYDTETIAQLGPALEMGRSFIRPEYQRNFTSLLLLWKGIGQFVRRYPRYRYLFGPVSITNDYHSISRQLMVAFLRLNHFLPELAGRVKPRRPMSLKAADGFNAARHLRGISGLDEVSQVVAEIERDGKGIPVLLRQYLKLGGKLLGFNVDEKFGNVVDGLILVDILGTDRRLMGKYMGREGAAEYLRHWGRDTLAPLPSP